MAQLVIKNVRSYSKERSINIDLSKKINLIYGQNGSGKSTISGYFYSPSNSSYRECSFSQKDDYQYVVYNNQFVEDSFYHKSEQPGVFTLSQSNKEVMEDIKQSDKKMASLKGSLTRLENGIKEKDEMLTKLENSCKDAVWKKTAHIRATELTELMTGSLRKDSLYNKICTQVRKDEASSDDVLNEYKKLKNNKSSSFNSINLPSMPILNRLQEELLLTPLIPSSNSYLSNVINELGNADWVKLGLGYVNDTKCPFCQGDTINNDFLKAIKDVFDETYELRLEDLRSFHNDYSKACDEFTRELEHSLNGSSYISDDDSIWSLITQIGQALELNKNAIKEKIEKPSAVISATDLSMNHDELNTKIKNLNGEIKEINDRLNIYEASISNVTNKLWMVLRNLCGDVIDNNNSNMDELKKERNTIIKRKETLEGEIQQEKNKLSQLRKQVSNMDETIDKINASLRNLGLNGLEIKKAHERNFFQIHRGNDNVEVYKSLSEGEKTIITFLYFLECCEGQLEEGEVKDKLIVIDDPISSLSHDYIYEISSLIHYRIIEGMAPEAKVLVLTHNLFFFQELLKLAPPKIKTFDKQYNLLRVVKNEFSDVIAMSKGDIKNEYESYWMVLKNVKDGIVNPVVLPNVMRNILEYYFSFSCKLESLKVVLEKLAESESDITYKSFCRYMHRGSHSDSSNINNLGRGATEKYFEIFKDVFDKTDDLPHYNRMFGSEIDKEMTE
ncbi:AAA family ATPase [Pantoea ananatis]|uniref:AAA family ATPase n=1 Tax=Pantoea ananas TaxID=553 RepID=UPI000D5E8173|nr:AAA family ATPase [Pantoea ananatis]PVY80656.1 wobble nucleotide-excising tRNase [Pantoea ananatis]